MAKEIKEVGIIGWDIALTTKGIDIVEGNSYPGHDIYQLPPHRTNNIGVLPRFEKYLKWYFFLWRGRFFIAIFIVMIVFMWYT